MNNACFYRISVKGLAVDEAGKILLAQKDNGRWDFLGGGLEHDENPIDGLKREITEESGLKVASASSSPKYFVTAKSLDHDMYIAYVIYEIKLTDLSFTPSDECRELKYFPVEDVKRINTTASVEKFLQIF